MTGKLLLLALLATAAACEDSWAIELRAADLEKNLDEHRLSLVVFAVKGADDRKLTDNGIISAVKLLSDDKKSVKVFLVDPSTDDSLALKHQLVTSPEVRMFWKGVPMLPPSLPRWTPTILYRWIKQNIRASALSTLRELDTVSFFEKYKEKHPFIVVGLGPKDSSEARFLQEFSKNPRWTYATYLITEKYAKTIFQSIGLTSSPFNILIINNLGKVIKEYDGDLDYKVFWGFLMEQTKLLGAINVKGREQNVRTVASTGNPFVLLALSEKSYNLLPPTFLKTMRTLSNEFRLNVLFGVNNQKIHEHFEYNDCEKDEDCLFVYSDYTHRAKKRRFKFSPKDLSFDSLTESLARHKYQTPEPYYYSSSYRAPEVDDRFVVLSRGNLPTFREQNKDIFVLLYKFCGSNCHDKLKYMQDALKEFAEPVLDRLTFAVCNVATNEMPEEFGLVGDLGFMYRRAGADSRFVDLPNYSSGYYIAKDIVKHASFQTRLREDEEEDLEEYL